jgi:hypothetical protein
MVPSSPYLKVSRRKASRRIRGDATGQTVLIYIRYRLRQPENKQVILTEERAKRRPRII